MKANFILFLTLALILAGNDHAGGMSEVFAGKVYTFGKVKPIDSNPTLRHGNKAPKFRLPSLNGNDVSLSAFRGEKNVVISFIPAVWEAVSSAQWSGYQYIPDLFATHEAILIGISTDNIPALYAWMKHMGGLWFPVLSDFHPQGRVARRYGILRSDGMAERAIAIVDKEGRIRCFRVMEIGERPKLEELVSELKKLSGR